MARPLPRPELLAAHMAETTPKRGSLRAQGRVGEASLHWFAGSVLFFIAGFLFRAWLLGEFSL